MIDINRTDHMDDGTLIRLLDGEGDADASSRWHLGMCSECQGRLATLRDIGGRLDDLLGTTPEAGEPRYDPEFLAAIQRPSLSIRTTPVGHRPRRVPAFALSAAAVLAALILVASPAGAWLVERIAQVLAPAPAPVVEEMVPVDVPSPIGSTVSAAVTGPRLTLRLTETSLPERVILSRGVGDMATATVRGASSPADVIVRPDGFDVVSAGGTLEIGLPPEVEAVEVWVGSRVAARWPGSDGAPLPWEFVTTDR